MYGFDPDPGRGQRLDRAVRADFARSLGTVLAALAEQGAVTGDEAARVAAVMADGHGAPGLVAAYAGLVEAIYADRTEDAAAAVAALLELAGRSIPPGIRIVTLDDALLGPGQAERYRALFDDDPQSPLAIAALAPTQLAAAERRALDGLDLLDRAVPELAGEVRAILREIVFARGVGGATDETFQGASSFLVWGAVLVNAAEQPDRVAMAETLAHETGHSILSGLSRGTPLVENPGDERRRSPLRTDLRPLDGIVHATYVLARMHHCLDRLIASGELDDAERTAAVTARDDRRRAFAAGLAVVDAHARLTETGRCAFEPARAYMAAQGV